MNKFETVHCLKCDGHFIEKHEETIEKCPHCNNDDMMETVYLTTEEN